MCVCVCVCVCVYMHTNWLSCVPLFATPMGWSPPGSSVHGTFQAKTLEWVANIYICYGIHPVKWVSMTSLSMNFCLGLCLSKIPIVQSQRKTVSKYMPHWVVLGAMNKAKKQV